MADVANGHDEDDGRAELQRHQAPEGPGESAASIGNAHQTDADAALDRHRAGGVKEFGNVEELMEVRKAYSVLVKKIP